MRLIHAETTLALVYSTSCTLCHGRPNSHRMTPSIGGVIERGQIITHLCTLLNDPPTNCTAETAACSHTSSFVVAVGGCYVESERRPPLPPSLMTSSVAGGWAPAHFPSSARKCEGLLCGEKDTYAHVERARLRRPVKEERRGLRGGTDGWLPTLQRLRQSNPLFLLPPLFRWGKGMRGEGCLPCHAENVVYFYDNAHVDVGQRRSQGGLRFGMGRRDGRRRWSPHFIRNP